MNCLFSVFMNSQCGATKKQGKTVSTPLSNCRRDVSRYLRSLGASGAQVQNSHRQVSEIDLIRNRAGLFMYSSDYVKRMTICPLHRKLLTLNWPGGKSSKCGYQSHETRHRRTGENSGNQRITKLVSEEIFCCITVLCQLKMICFYFLNSILHYLEFFKK